MFEVVVGLRLRGVARAALRAEGNAAAVAGCVAQVCVVLAADHHCQLVQLVVDT